MKIGVIRSKAAAGALLAHALRVGGAKWKKGRRLSEEDIRQLRDAKIDSLAAVMLDADDVAEDEAAARLAAILRGEHLRVAAAHAGRVNVFSERAGVLCFSAAEVRRLNAVSPSLTVAVLSPFATVEVGAMIATVKIIPFAVRRDELHLCEQLPCRFSVTPFVNRRVGLIQTVLSPADAGHDKTRRVTDERLAALGAAVIAESRVPHDPEFLAAAVRQMRARHKPDLLLIAGASAALHRQDTAPAAVVAAGGDIIRIGMPVDPGNLLFLARLDNMPIIGLPGCAKSPKLNGFDWVLARAVAGVPITADDLGQMGVGGLLADIRERPFPRQKSPAPKVAAILLAAGESRRMGGDNKLLASWRGEPLLLAAAKTMAAARRAGDLQHTVAVVGRDGDKTALLLADAADDIVHNPAYARGMASSLQCGLKAVDADAVMIFLADMPSVSPADIAAVVKAFRESGGGIVVPTHNGKRGNPVLLAKSQFAKLRALQGDTGARALFADSVLTCVETGAGVLDDVDTPQHFPPDTPDAGRFLDAEKTPADTQSPGDKP